MKKLLNIVEFCIVRLMLFIFGRMSFATASNVGGFLGRNVGPLLGVNKTARNNIKMAMPGLTDKKTDEIIDGMWDNLGRVVTEFSHMDKMSPKKIDGLLTVNGLEHLDKLFKTGRGGLIMTGHLGNWEMIPIATHRHGYPLDIVYRKANNPYIDTLIYKLRQPFIASAYAKGSVGARHVIQSLKQGNSITMLVDQKQNDGISVPFFGIPAMTAPGIANLALKYNCPIIPTRVVRTVGHKFSVNIYPAINVAKSGNNEEDRLNLMTEINIILENWIREKPQQWFWVHNRWPKNNIKN